MVKMPCPRKWYAGATFASRTIFMYQGIGDTHCSSPLLPIAGQKTNIQYICYRLQWHHLTDTCNRIWQGAGMLLYKFNMKFVIKNPKSGLHQEFPTKRA